MLQLGRAAPLIKACPCGSGRAACFELDDLAMSITLAPDLINSSPFGFNRTNATRLSAILNTFGAMHGPMGAVHRSGGHIDQAAQQLGWVLRVTPNGIQLRPSRSKGAAPNLRHSSITDECHRGGCGTPKLEPINELG